MLGCSHFDGIAEESVAFTIDSGFDQWTALENAMIILAFRRKVNNAVRKYTRECR